eukprot:1611677-Ditylum_brightwellii.AAC.1
MTPKHRNGKCHQKYSILRCVSSALHYMSEIRIPTGNSQYSDSHAQIPPPQDGTVVAMGVQYT